MHLALYRKFRPKTFDEVIGQGHITQTLKNQIKNDEISHAYLFNGTRGTGKTSVAKIFAQSINCENSKDGSPCLKCKACVAMASPNNMDILEIDAASNNRVDEVRELREKVKYPPVNGKYKVYIIDEVHMLTDSAFNALLKTLEEPPAHVVFVLATTEVQKLPATILSRCMRFDFKLVGVKELENHLEKLLTEIGAKYEKEALSLIAALGQGSVRDTLSVADTVVSFSNKNVTYKAVLDAVGAIDKRVLHVLGKAILEKDAKQTITSINQIVSAGKSETQLAKDLSAYFRNLAIIKTTNNYKEILSLPDNLLSELESVAQNHLIETVLQNLKAFSSLDNQFRTTLNPGLVLEVAALTSVTDRTQELEKRISELEKILLDDNDKTLKKKNKTLNVNTNKPEIIKVVELSVSDNDVTLKGEIINKLPESGDILPENDTINEINDENEDESFFDAYNSDEYFFEAENEFIKTGGVFVVDENDFVYDEKADYNIDSNKFNKDGTINKNWLHGKMLIMMREKQEFSLHGLLGGGVQISITDNTLKFITNDDVKLLALKREKTQAIINSLLKELNLSFNLDFELVKGLHKNKNSTLDNLINLFGRKLIVQ